MLVSMTVRNIALIENLHIDFHSGMHVLSGETGAGKSIIVDSINLVLGERADRGLIRSGCERASVEALIDLDDCPQVLELLKEQELVAEGNLLSIQREITTAERNLCRVCGVIVPVAFLRKLSALLMDVHGQHEHQSLLDSKNHMGFLDSFGDECFFAQRENVAEAYRSWKESSSRFSSLRKENAQREQRQEYLSARIKELDSAHIAIGESAKLAAEHARFAGAQHINTALRTAYEQIYAGGQEQSAMNKLKDALDAIRGIGELDEQFQALGVRLSSVYYETEEIGLELRDLLEKESFDPNRSELVQERLDLLRRMERRYGISADELAARHEEMREELKGLGSMETRLKHAEGDFKQKLLAYRGEAAKLTQARHALAERFEGLMEEQLRDLGMEKTRFRCLFEELSPDQKKVPTANGDDHISFYIAPNPGEPLKPLDKTASGGELSRLMLAMKAAGAENGGIPCMIFDEIDTGISGHVSVAVAEKMAAIARYHQVLCVTHQAQIAAMADTHYLVQKQVMGERTYTCVKELSGEERVEEIARLLGVTNQQQESGIAHARSILQNAQRWKQSKR
ncbi:MAG: DNA repair protein RecN [Clostridia bacterium]